jgi:AcrR family transcriptional regulator
MNATRERIVETSAELFRRQGYAATGIKQIATEAQAPFGSLYHFFPGGKEQLAAESIRASGAIYELLVPAIFDPAPDVVSAVRAFFAGAAEHVRETDYADACPIATIALEGAFVLARAVRSTEALEIAGELTAAAVTRALEAGAD